MSDSFADLWKSTGVVKPSEPPRKLGSLQPIVPPARNVQNDAFSMLASSTSASTPRSLTPATGPIQSTRSLGTNGNVSAKPLHKSASSGSDAFSGLLAGTLASSSTNHANMTIAERAAKAERDRLQQQQKQQAAGKQTSSAWVGLDALGDFTPKPATTQRAEPTDDDWAFDMEPTKPSTQHALSQPTEDDWGLDEFTSKPAPTKDAVATKSSGSLWDDFDDFESAPPPPSTSHHSPQPPVTRSRSPGEFDFGDREDRLLDDDSNDEDDILGVLSKPVRKAPPSTNQSARASPSSQSQPHGQPSRAVSPPPHIVGQIVEMGFTPQQARVALAATDTGLDSRGTRRARLEYSDDIEHADEIPPRHRQPTPGRQGASPPARESAAETQRNLQEQADKLLAQASVIGTTMFNRANAFWKEGREKVQRAYEERAAAAATARPSTEANKNGRPRWMQEAPDRTHDDGWHDDEHEAAEVLPPRPSSQPRAKPVDARREPDTAARGGTGNLLVDDTPAVYVSPFRRKAPSRADSDASASSSKTRAPPHARPQDGGGVARGVAASAKHKAAGTEMFKLGRYAEAETAYSAALAALPAAHLLRIPLLNNRALTRIKTGDHAAVGAGFHPAREAKVARRKRCGVDLGDALVKAFRRRAEAYEGREKWDAARQDWEVLAGRSGRAGRMLTAGADTVTPVGAVAPRPAVMSRPKPKPKSTPASRPVQRGSTPPSAALNRVREANEAAEAEDQARHELKDVVDTRLGVWKNGKENNIRALIASLDTVLWPELGWQKVGMHELVTPSQVKIRYTKAIAKLHPDKLSANNTTVEQRMIANGVFGSLNDAWNAFKQ
ncbi:hypothetical protein B0H21DRAFT_778711 [Amylocystis lapponica]|nr:hypothetical protein B0H21DRAFT_778711 [Amylocystis lapponica]